MALRCATLSLVAVAAAAQQSPSPSPGPIPGKVLPKWPSTYNMTQSTAIMICNNSGPVDATWAKPWGLVDVDWNSNKVTWSKTLPSAYTSDATRRAEISRISAYPSQWTAKRTCSPT